MRPNTDFPNLDRLATLMAFHPGLKKNNEDPEIESGAQPLDDDIDDTENLVFNESNLGHSAALSVEEAMLHAKSTVALCSCEKSQTMVDRRFKRCKTCKHTKCSYWYDIWVSYFTATN